MIRIHHRNPYSTKNLEISTSRISTAGPVSVALE
jgi:hypothetical protein